MLSVVRVLVRLQVDTEHRVQPDKLLQVQPCSEGQCEGDGGVLPCRHSSLLSSPSPSTQPIAMLASIPNLAASLAVMEWRLGLKFDPD